MIDAFKRSLASTDAHDPQSFIDGAKWAEAQQAQHTDMQPVIAILRSTLSAIANTLDDSELRAAAKQAYDDSFEQERKIKFLDAAPPAPQQVVPNDLIEYLQENFCIGRELAEQYAATITLKVSAQQVARNETPTIADAWAEAQRICDLPDVDESIRGFSDDPTGDNATCMVRAVLAAAQVTPDRKDADRYRFLRDGMNRTEDLYMPGGTLHENEKLDAAIDAAMQKEQGK